MSHIIARCESTAFHARLVHERPHELRPAVRARLDVGFHVSAHDYIQALRLRARLTRAFIREFFAETDVLIAPVIPEAAPALAEVKAGSVEEIGLGLPALSVLCGFSAAGLPLAFQAVGRPFDEATLLRLGHAYEQATDWHRRRPLA